MSHTLCSFDAEAQILTTIAKLADHLPVQWPWPLQPHLLQQLCQKQAWHLLHLLPWLQQPGELPSREQSPSF